MYKSFEQAVVEHCAPTLAGIKTGNLFRYLCDTSEKNSTDILFYSTSLAIKGVRILILKNCPNSSLVYVYRPAKLERDFQNKEVTLLLSEAGYKDCSSIADYLNILSEKILCRKNFPHEIGLFLGYPIGDVKGFIENQGENFRCCGCWKVYGNKGEAEKQFTKYKKCKSIYMQMHNNGKSVLQLTVAA